MDAFRFFNRAQGTMRDRVATQSRPKRLLRLFLAFLIGAVSVLPLPGLTPPAAAAAFVVNSTGDSGDLAPGNGLCDTGALNSESNTECTLRAAVEEANALAGLDIVAFSIPVTEAGYSSSPNKWTIFPSTDLTTTAPIVLDATTQPTYSGMPLVVLDGTSNLGENLLTVEGGSSTISGFAFHNNSDDAIEIEFGDGNTVQSNFFGIEVDGLSPVGAAYAISIKTDFNVIGGSGPGEGNVFAAIVNDSLYLTQSASNNIYRGNKVGTDFTGTVAVGNGNGLILTNGASDNMIGGPDPGDGNIIANNSLGGVSLEATAGTGNAVLGNTIYNNGAPPIDLLADGITPNDPGDGDSGPNDLLNFPVITDAAETAGTLSVDFDLDVPAGDYRIEFFRNPGAVPEGEIFVDFYALTHPGGVAFYTTSIAGSSGDLITATGTIDVGSYGSTSEFSAGFTATLSANLPPIADAGGPYSIAEGEALLLDGSNSSDPDADPLIYRWDLNNDLTYGDVIGVSPNVSWATLVSFGVDDNGIHTIGLEVDDSSGGTATDTEPATVFNTEPTISTSGSATSMSGSVYTLNLGATDPGVDTVTEWVIDWGDGTTQTIPGNPLSTTHTYTGPSRTYNVLAAVTDEDGTYLQNDLVVAGYLSHNTIRYEAPFGRNPSPLQLGFGMDNPYDVAIAPSGDYYVAAYGTHAVYRYDGTTGNYVAQFAAGTNPVGLEFGPDGDLYVTSYGTNEVLRFDGLTDASLGVFVTAGSGGLTGPTGMTFGPDGDLYVSGWDDDAIYRYDGSTGASLGVFVSAGSGGLDSPEDIAFGPDGHLYVADPVANLVRKYNGTTGASLGVFTSGASATGAIGVVFAPDGYLYVTEYWDDIVQRYDATTGVYVDEYVPAGFGGLDGPSFMTFVPGQQIDVVATGVKVNSTGDASDNTPGDNVCDTGGLNSDGDPECTLRAAIEEANAGPINTIEFNIPISDAGYSVGPPAYWSIAPASALPNLTTDMTIDATTQAGWIANTNSALQALNGTLVIELDGSSVVADDGLHVSGATVTIRGVVVNRFGDVGIKISNTSSESVVVGNYVGTDITGTIGGIYASGPVGIVVKNASTNTQIGGPNPEDRNLIGDAGGDLLRVADAGTDGTVIQGNLIGTNATGTASVVAVSASDGIDVQVDADNTQILDNVISGVGQDGIDVAGATNVTIYGNWIGVDITGNAALGNASDGIEVKTSSSNVTIGGSGLGEPNVISANGSRGIHLDTVSVGIVIQANLIGVGADTVTPLGNASRGVYLATGSNNVLIGGTSAGDGNIIAHNSRGAQIRDGTGNSVLGNSIFANSSLGIDLAPGGVTGVTPNDGGDLDSGPNDLLNFPVVTTASESTGTVTVDFDLDVPAGDYRIEAFTNPSGADASGYGEGEVYENATTITHNGSGVESFQMTYSGTAGDVVTLTATEESAGPAYGSTSEFSATFTVVASSKAVVNSSGDASDLVPGDGVCDTGGAAVDANSECTLRAAIEEANASVSVDSIEFNIPVTDSGHLAGVWTLQPASALPAVTADSTIDAFTQPGFSGQPAIELDGSLAGISDGIRFEAAVTLRGLAIVNWSDDGIDVSSSAAGSVIVGNHVGVDATGLIARGNGDDGIDIAGPSITVGGPAEADRNVISGNAQDGIEIGGASVADVNILGNYIGTDITGLVDLGNGDDGIQIYSTATGTLVGGTALNEGNVISGNGGRGIDIFGVGTTGNIVQGNLIGVDKDGNSPLPNDQDGILIDAGASSNTIGGTAGGAGNVISSNTGDGIHLAGASTTANLIQGNIIGLGSDGTTIVGNGASGIEVNFDTGFHTIGGSSAGAGNVISANANSGIRAFGVAAVAIEGNIVGLDAAGALDRGNGSHGVWVRGTTITIGGSTTGYENVISGNGDNGVWLDSADGVIVEGNIIGANAAGTAAVPNVSFGIFNSGSNTLLKDNLVSGNMQDGIQVSSGSSGVAIQGNRIGSDDSGTAPIPNGWAGIRFFGSNGTIGGTIPAEGNLIAHNTGAGIHIGSAAIGNSIMRNALVSNGGLGIDLEFDGVTPNDLGDGDSGGNDLLNFPVVTSASESLGIVSVDFDLDVPAGDYRVEVFTNPSGIDPSGNGEGETFGNSTTITHTGSGSEPFQFTYTGTIGDAITLTATEEAAGPVHGSTSEFSVAFTVTQGAFIVNSTGDAPDSIPGDGDCDTGGLNSQGATECTLRAAIEETNARVGSDLVGFNLAITESGYVVGPPAYWSIQPTSSLPPITDQVTINAYTQPGASTNTVAFPGLTDAVLTVEIDGSAVLGTGLALNAGSSGSAICGLAINRFSGDGIYVLSTNVAVTGNYIGTDVTGTIDLGNSGDGIQLLSGNNAIGGATPAARNVISGNNQFGIFFDAGSADNNTVRGNFIGVDATGNSALANADDGIRLQNAASSNTIGGTGAGDANVISANGGNGFEIGDSGTSNNIIEGNYVGVGADGVTSLGNGDPGIWIGASASNNTVGGTAPGSGNIIANNSSQGVRIFSGTGNSVLGNQIYSNGSIGIDLGTSGVTANDPGDGDTGANGLLNYPVVIKAVEAAGTVTVAFDLDVPIGDYRIEVFTNPSGADPSGYGEGEAIQGATTITHTGSGNESFEITFVGATGDIVSLSATEESAGPVYGSTSEFSATFTAVAPTTVIVNSTGDLPDASPGDDVCDSGFLNSEGDPECTLRAAIEEANASAPIDTIDFNIPNTEAGYVVGPPAYWSIQPATELPTVTDVITIDGYTQPGASVGTTTFPSAIDAVLVIELNGSLLTSMDGLNVSAGSSTIRGLVINDFTGPGANGIVLQTGAGNVVEGNFIGTDITGSVARTITGYGIHANSASNLIGGSGTGAGNLISGGSAYGVVLAGANQLIQGNFFGTDVTGTVDITSGTGIGVFTGNDSIIDGNGAGEGNLISGQNIHGIWTNSSPVGVTIEGNRIGTDITGTSALGNGTGVYVNADNVTVGGTGAGEGNLISGNNSGIGVSSSATGTVIAGNLIGTDVTGTLAVGNLVGITIQSTGVMVGGTTAGSANTIAHSDQDNVRVWTTGIDSSILGNSIYGSDAAAADLGIDLNNDGVTLNDAGDVDTGPNDLLNFPVITAASESAGTVTVDFDLDVPAGDYRIEAFTNPSGADPSGYGEGEIYENATTITHTGSGTETFQITYTGSTGDIVSLTTTEESAGPLYGSTSEFSAVTTAVLNTAVIVNSTGDSSDTIPGNDVCDTGLLNSDGDPECTLRAAIEEANASANVDTINFSIPTSDPGYLAAPLSYTIQPNPELPALSSPTTLDATTQPDHAGAPIIVLDGTLAAGGGQEGLKVDGGSSTIRGLVINNWTSDGVQVGSNGNNVFESNYIGTDVTGAIAAPNARGFLISQSSDGNRIGGTSPGAGNVISGNGGSGIWVYGTSNQLIEGNIIGLDPTGTIAVPNALAGVEISQGASGVATGTTVGGSTAAARNIISGKGGGGGVCQHPRCRHKWQPGDGQLHQYGRDRHTRQRKRLRRHQHRQLRHECHRWWRLG